MEASAEPDHIPDVTTKVESLAAEQGVKPVADIRQLFGDADPVMMEQLRKGLADIKAGRLSALLVDRNEVTRMVNA
jgi:hypothetical protein